MREKIATWILAIVATGIIFIIISVCVAECNMRDSYKYTIHYNEARYSTSDFTNEYQSIPGSSGIRYVNQNGDSIYRNGSFWIEKAR